jgi:hypothetical protein
MIYQQCSDQANFKIGKSFAINLFWQIFENILHKCNFLQQLETKSQLWETRLTLSLLTSYIYIYMELVVKPDI